ncbi:hypothetical protein DAEQUDRAFT_807842 [Daedalea quercina L-15889]|uniref:Uncharacterized protein n=1 Tax=Daedalea quercina L-15889 TaxID=1314783 RepID=A0A165TYX7_9APHY|nr:hypothetical protein DAEQUDRAFT_807842 [Daedalea quercina L-15889]
MVELLQYYLEARPGDLKSDDSDDSLPDDIGKSYVCLDTPGARELSPWVNWRHDPDAPLLSVIVMARGGRKYSLAEDDWDESNQLEIRQLLDDLSSGFILHDDFRPANIVLAPADARECIMHKCIHKWNIIDFAWSLVDDPFDQSRPSRLPFFDLPLTGARIRNDGALSDKKRSLPANFAMYGPDEARSRPYWRAAQAPENRGRLSPCVDSSLGNASAAGDRLSSMPPRSYRSVWRVLCVIDPEGLKPRTRKLCVKIARPDCYRTLARGEA